MIIFSGLKQLEYNTNNSNPVSTSLKHDIALNGSAFRLENFLNKIISNSMLHSLNNQSMLNMSTASSTSLAELSKSKLNANDSSLLANSHVNSTLLHPKYKIKRDDYYGLLRQSLKCFSLNVSTMSIDHSIDDSFDMSDCSQLSLHNDTALTRKFINSI